MAQIDLRPLEEKDTTITLEFSGRRIAAIRPLPLRPTTQASLHVPMWRKSCSPRPTATASCVSASARSAAFPLGAGGRSQSSTLPTFCCMSPETTALRRSKRPRSDSCRNLPCPAPVDKRGPIEESGCSARGNNTNISQPILAPLGPGGGGLARGIHTEAVAARGVDVKFCRDFRMLQGQVHPHAAFGTVCRSRRWRG